MGKFTYGQQVALAIAPKVSTVLSILGSSWITAEVLRDEFKMEMIYHRLMLVMSIGDIVRSVAQFCTTWPMPSDTPGVYGAAGTTGTCTAQGFIFQMGLFFILYNAYLAVYYVQVLFYGLSDRRMKRMEIWAFCITVFLSLSTAIAGLPLKLYNAANLWCWIAPLNCNEEGNRDCERGENSWIYRYAFWYVWLWTTFAVVTLCMFRVIFSLRSQERRLSRSQGGDSDVSRRMNSCRRVATGQALYYTITFFLQISFNTATRVIQQQTGKIYFPLVLLMAFFAPLNGFWGGLIYLRPRFLSLKARHPDWSTRHLIRQVLSRLFENGSARREDDSDDYQLGVVTNDGNGEQICSLRYSTSPGGECESGHVSTSSSNLESSRN